MFNQKETEIFRYDPLNLSVDPLTAQRKLVIATEGNLHTLVVTYNESDSPLDRAKAEDALISGTRSAFSLPPITKQGGVSDAAVLSLLSAFLEWLSRPLEQQPNPSAIGSECTDCPQPL